MRQLIPKVDKIRSFGRKLIRRDTLKDKLKTVADLHEWAQARTLKQLLIDNTKLSDLSSTTDVVGHHRQLGSLLTKFVTKHLKLLGKSVFALHHKQRNVESTTVNAEDANCDPPGHDPFEGSGATVQACMEEIDKINAAYAAMQPEGEGEEEAEEAQVGCCGMAMHGHCPNL